MPSVTQCRVLYVNADEDTCEMVRLLISLIEKRSIAALKGEKPINKGLRLLSRFRQLPGYSRQRLS